MTGVPSGSDLSDGSYQLRSSATDAAGNLETSGAARSVVIDATPPVVAITAPTSGAILGLAMPALEANVSDVGGLRGVQFQLSSDARATWSDVGPPIDRSPFSHHPTVALNEGTHSARAQGVDLAGNAATSSVVEFVIDTTAPTAPTVVAATDRPDDRAGVVALTWVPSVSADVVAQRVYRATNGSPFALAQTFNDNTTAMATDGRLSNGTSYTYVVRAVYRVNRETADSNQAAVVPIDDSAVAPETTITAGPEPQTTATNATFHFTSSSATGCLIAGLTRRSSRHALAKLRLKPTSAGFRGLGWHHRRVQNPALAGGADDAEPQRRHHTARPRIAVHLVY
jgi:Big-like domain-containing protein